MKLLRRFRLKRIAKAYAATLPRQLQMGWGKAEHYTPAQIKAAVQKSGLDPDWIVLGYAAFLAEEQFRALESEMPIPFAFEDARALFQHYRPSASPGAWEPMPENPNHWP